MTAEDYLGIPFRAQGRDRAGADCWGLVRLVLRERHGVQVADFGEHYSAALERRALAPLIEQEAGRWLPVAGGQERAGDVVVMKEGRWPTHVGIVWAPGWVLHVEWGGRSRVDALGAAYVAPRLEGIYRHRELIAP